MGRDMSASAQDINCDLAEVKRLALEINCELKFTKEDSFYTLVTRSPPRGTPGLASVEGTMAGMNLT
jgi:hypothetical protein